MSSNVSLLPSLPLSHAKYVDRQGPGISYYTDHVDQLNHWRQLQLVMVADLTLPTLNVQWRLHGLTAASGQVQPWRQVGWYCLVNVQIFANHSSLNRKSTQSSCLLCRMATVANGELGTWRQAIWAKIPVQAPAIWPVYTPMNNPRSSRTNNHRYWTVCFEQPISTANRFRQTKISVRVHALVDFDNGILALK